MEKTNSTAKSVTWIPETAAADMVKRHPRTLRMHVTQGNWDINYSTLNGRDYHYCEEDIKALRTKHSTVVRSGKA